MATEFLNLFSGRYITMLLGSFFVKSSYPQREYYSIG